MQTGATLTTQSILSLEGNYNMLALIEAFNLPMIK